MAAGAEGALDAMRVLMLMDNYHQDEVGRFLFRLSQRLTPLPGLTLNSVAFEGGPLMDQLSSGAVGVRVLRLRRRRPVSQLRNAGRTLARRADRPDVVHVFCRWPSLRWRLLIGGLEDVPAVWTPPEARRSTILQWIGRGLGAFSHFGGGRHGVREVMALLPGLRPRLPAPRGREAKLLVPGVDAVQTYPLPDFTRLRMRILLNVDWETPLVAIPLHRWLTAYEEDWLIRMLVQLHDAVPEAVFCLVGVAMEGNSLHLMLEDAGLTAATRRIGPVPEYLPRVLGAADLAILPFVNGGFHLYAAEAQAAGVPVLAVRSEDNSYFVREGETGMLVPRADGAAMRRAMTTMLEDRERLRAMGEAGRRMVQEEFEAGLTARALLDLWNSLAPDAAVEYEIRA